MSATTVSPLLAAPAPRADAAPASTGAGGATAFQGELDAQAGRLGRPARPDPRDARDAHPRSPGSSVGSAAPADADRAADDPVPGSGPATRGAD
ncbi:MAG: hypothetical protein ACTHJL_02780 [Amnibacterium sp.]